MQGVRRASLLLVVLMIGPASAGSGDRVGLSVSPRIGIEPALVTIQVTVEKDADNRLLEVAAESPDYRRSSQITLEGSRAPRVNIVEFPALPAGTYEVTCTLTGQSGGRITLNKLLLVVEGSVRPRRR